jgi:hypothetical protein
MQAATTSVRAHSEAHSALLGDWIVVLRRLGRVACGDPFGRRHPGSADGRTTSCALVRRCASIRRAGHRPTSDLAPASPVRQQWFLPTAPPMHVRQLSRSARSRSGQQLLLRPASIGPRREEAPIPLARGRSVTCATPGHSTDSGPYAQEGPSQRSGASRANRCRANRRRRWNIGVATVPRHNYSSRRPRRELPYRAAGATL